MADKRISQLIDRGTVLNNDVIPIVVSGAVTTNKATISSIQTFMQSNLDVGVTSVGITIGSTGTDVNVTGSPVTSSGNITINIPTASATNRGLLSSADWTTFNNKVSSVGLSMPSAFSVANSPITGSGTIAVTGAGTVSQYIRGDGSLADFPQGGGGGSSVNYYLNGSVSQGTIGGIAYQEMNKTPVLGAGTDFVAIADGYLASFITDAGDPALLEIPAGNWNFETYFSASSGGGTPTFYVELYKVNSGGTATLIASNSGTPELIAFGTTITPYFSTLAVPTTALAITDRLALRYYVARSGRTITLHTENSHLCQIITTFTTGLTALNGLTAQVQNFATGTSGTDFGISSSVSTHTFNLPDASASARGVVTTGTQTFAGYKIFTGTISANNDIQLAAAGTASTTFIKNISGAGLTSVGSNGFGFNNSDNIYFSGSNKGGGIIAFSNTGNQTYTLQDASGTLALTSDIPANPVGGTGAAGRVAYWNGSGTITSDSIFQWNDTFRRLGIGCTPTVSLDVVGAGVFTSSVTGSNAILTGVGGVLSRTGATTTAVYGLFLNTSGGLYFGSEGSAGGTVITGNPAYFGAVSAVSGLGFSANNGNNVHLSLASTGAATFSSSVTANYGGTFVIPVESPASGSVALTARTSNGANDVFRWFDGATQLGVFKNNGNVGIGTASPGSKAEVYTTLGASVGINHHFDAGTYPRCSGIGLGANSTSYTVASGGGTISFVGGAGMYAENTASSGNPTNLVFWTNLAGTPAQQMRINAAGQTTIFGSGNSLFVTSSNNSLSLALGYQGAAHGYIGGINSRLEGYSNNGGYAFLNASSVWVPASDIKRKRNFEEYTLGIDAIMGLKPTLYNMDFQEDGDEKQVGFIAQEVKEFIPQAYEEDLDFIGLNYNAIIVTMVKAIQELKTEIDSLKNQIK